MTHPGARVKELRKRNALTQIELAKKTGVSPVTVIRIEQMAVDPQAGTVRKLAAALGVTPPELFD